MKNANEEIKHLMRGGNEYADDRWIQLGKSLRRSRGNSCQSCKRGDVATQVHHVNYRRGAEIWDYDEEELVLLCAECHDKIHKSIIAFRDTASRVNATNMMAITGLLVKLIRADGDRGALLKLARLLQ